MTTSFTSRRLATSYEILVARTEFLLALVTRKVQFRTLLLDTSFNPRVQILHPSLCPQIMLFAANFLQQHF